MRIELTPTGTEPHAWVFTKTGTNAGAEIGTFVDPALAQLHGTYTYTVTGATTATLVLKYADDAPPGYPGVEDAVSLTFTLPSTGTYDIPAVESGAFKAL